MTIKRVLLQIAILAACCGSVANAGVCDYRPSSLIGGAGSTAVGGGAAGVAVIGAGAKAAGVYTLVHAASGLTMVGGTWAGTSAAGTAGILAGTGGAIGTTVAVLTAPATLVAGAATAVVVGSFEGACYFADSRITDYDEINAIVANIAVTAPRHLFRYYAGPEGEQEAMIQVRRVPEPEPSDDQSTSEDEEKIFDLYRVKNLYVVNGALKSRDWGPNTTIGLIGKIKSEK